jgi:hypothetical protein
MNQALTDFLFLSRKAGKDYPNKDIVCSDVISSLYTFVTNTDEEFTPADLSFTMEFLTTFSKDYFYTARGGSNGILPGRIVFDLIVKAETAGLMAYHRSKSTNK